MTINPNISAPVKTESKEVEDIEKFVCLGAMLDKTGGTDCTWQISILVAWRLAMSINTRLPSLV